MAEQSIVGSTTFNSLTFLATRSISLASSANFVVAGSFLAVGSENSMIVMTATTSGQRAIFRVNSAQSVRWVDATDIDSRVGVTVVNSLGLITNTLNWNTGNVLIMTAGPLFFEFFEG